MPQCAHFSFMLLSIMNFRLLQQSIPEGKPGSLAYPHQHPQSLQEFRVFGNHLGPVLGQIIIDPNLF